VDTIGFIGAGNMAEALIKGVISSKLYAPENVFISDIKKERLELLSKEYGVVSCETNNELVTKVQAVILSIKPQNMTDALESIKDSVGTDKIIISIAAGIKVSDITAVLGDIAIVRVMPNTPALIGQGASALFANEHAKTNLEKIVEILSSCGKAVIVEDEDLIDAVTALSGSGPAYYFLLMEEMIKTGARLGLPDDVAKDLVLQTAKGAGLLAVDADSKGESPAVLRQKVTSPGGTTEAALAVFKEGKISELISAAINSAYERSKELSQ
jgi:pyrroline-5-carboxylate reductase